MKLKEKTNELDTTIKTKEVFSLQMAVYLRQLGFEIIGKGVNPNRPEYDTWFFEDTEELGNAMAGFKRHNRY